MLYVPLISSEAGLRIAKQSAPREYKKWLEQRMLFTLMQSVGTQVLIIRPNIGELEINGDAAAINSKKLIAEIKKVDPQIEIIENNDDSSNWELELIGRFLINAGWRLVIPEPVDATNPYTWIDEVFGVVFIVIGLTLIAIS